MQEVSRLFSFKGLTITPNEMKVNPKRLEVIDQVLILLLTDSNKLLTQWRGPYTVESRVGANDHRVKMESKTKAYVTRSTC